MSGRLSFAVHYWLKRADRGALGGRDPYRPLVDDSLSIAWQIIPVSGKSCSIETPSSFRPQLHQTLYIHRHCPLILYMQINC
jgi:hypothetical protein